MFRTGAKDSLSFNDEVEFQSVYALTKSGILSNSSSESQYPHCRILSLLRVKNIVESGSLSAFEMQSISGQRICPSMVSGTLGEYLETFHRLM